MLILVIDKGAGGPIGVMSSPCYEYVLGNGVQLHPISLTLNVCELSALRLGCVILTNESPILIE